LKLGSLDGKKYVPILEFGNSGKQIKILEDKNDYQSWYSTEKHGKEKKFYVVNKELKNK
jgi:hypothetical protein